MEQQDKKNSELPVIRLLGENYREWLPALTLEKAVVYKNYRKWDIYINASSYIDSKKLRRLENKIKERFKEVNQIRIKVCYPQGFESFRSDFDRYWNDIVESIKCDIPSCAGWLNYCKGVLYDDELHLYVSDNTVMEFLKIKSLDKYIEDLIFTTFKHPVKVKLKLYENSKEKTSGRDYLQQKKLEDSNLVLALTEQKSLLPNSGDKNEKVKIEADKDSKETVIWGKTFNEKCVSIGDLREDSGRVAVKGTIFDIEIKKTKGNKVIFCIDITDYTGSITAKIFTSEDKAHVLEAGLKKGQWVRVRGDCTYDRFQREIVLWINDIIAIPFQKRVDNAKEKRVELHLHTHMSAMDAVSSARALIQRAAEWGHPAVAVTDHGVVQAFPEAYEAAKEYGIKVIYGVEAYLINDCKPLVINSNDKDFNQTFVVLDIETTGLNKEADEIIEIGAVKIQNKRIIDSFHTFVDPGIPIPAYITKLTGITDEMVKEAPSIEEVLHRFKCFFGESVLVAHNASFDLGFIKEKAQKAGLEVNNPVVDTLALSRELLKGLKRHKLNIVAEHLGVRLDRHHRALDDARATAEILVKLLDILEEKGIHFLKDINTSITRVTNLNGLKNYHAIILAKNYTGLKNLYILVSKSHLDYYYRRPRIPKSLLMQYREGLIVGSGCEAGEVYRAILEGAPDEEIHEIVQFYDYLEIQPVENNGHFLREGRVKSSKELEDINRRIVHLGEKYGKLVVATGDVHFLDPQDEYFRRIILSGQGYEDADYQPPLYFKTTEEMLKDFHYLGKEKAKEVVIDAPKAIAEQIEHIKPIPDELYPPEIPGAEEEITKMAWQKAISIYGNPLPEIVEHRLKRELDSIINNGFAVLYLIAHKLVKKSLNDGYLVGSRGSVGSSFVATMTDITEVNPLPPHYVCPKCKHSDFNIDINKYSCGVDLPDKNCPVCGTLYKKDGFDIPFEVFLGFKGDKVPDIDLNFSGEYQAIAHKYTEELFGKGHVFRAGTIATIAEKTAYGFVKKYLEEKGKTVTSAEIKRLVAGCTGVKRTTGQHPGGVMVVPKNNDIYQFTPIQYPADDKNSGVITTHFDYHSISSRLVKLDILGHDDPTVIRMLEDLTGVDARSIPLDEKKTMGIFSSTEPLGINPEDINCPVGTFGIPEFGTRFVRQMLAETRPKTFAELIRISGLSHGTDVWLNNAQDLIRNGVATLSEVISTRDDIMLYLIHKGVDPTISFKIMESVRKGKGLTPEFEEAMREKDVPEWFINSCKKIKYMFPKAHAAAYVIMAFRIAYFKVHYPKAFYATYFTVRADDFDAAVILQGKEAVGNKIREIESKGNNISPKEKNLLTILEVALEMYSRKLRFLPIDLYKSDPVKFLITEDGIRPPLNALQGIGSSAARNIGEARKAGKFISIEDLRERAKINKNIIEILKNNGVLDDIPETSQISLFKILH